jgi:hypothetical protein
LVASQGVASCSSPTSTSLISVKTASNVGATITSSWTACASRGAFHAATAVARELSTKTSSSTKTSEPVRLSNCFATFQERRAKSLSRGSFVYLGIPQAVFDYRPKMPGRKMSIFLTVTIGLTSAYIYDRRECERLQKEYVDKVKWMSEAPLESGESVRKVKVYGARVPEDGELERSSKWFKRYMRVSDIGAEGWGCKELTRLWRV